MNKIPSLAVFLWDVRKITLPLSQIFHSVSFSQTSEKKNSLISHSQQITLFFNSPGHVKESDRNSINISSLKLWAILLQCLYSKFFLESQWRPHRLWENTIIPLTLQMDCFLSGLLKFLPRSSTGCYLKYLPNGYDTSIDHRRRSQHWKPVRLFWITPSFPSLPFITSICLTRCLTTSHLKKTLLCLPSSFRAIKNTIANMGWDKEQMASEEVEIIGYQYSFEEIFFWKELLGHTGSISHALLLLLSNHQWPHPCPFQWILFCHRPHLPLHSSFSSLAQRSVITCSICVVFFAGFFQASFSVSSNFQKTLKF